ncbi:PREDICTED: uncharacterized protein LOC109162227 [Ipomoea nil]|uniref:uncharacterized protein LOC109162227 n=1 Tax=Ipomoea nil TaxID=35883 RepID=UPI000900884B|nr:PREDICTED: uncharacterized protein LOC109162227 [Ipomoea nil]
MSPRRRIVSFEEVCYAAKRPRTTGVRDAPSIVEQWIRSGTSTRISPCAATLPSFRDLRRSGGLGAQSLSEELTQERTLILSEARAGDSDVVIGTFLVHAVPAVILFDSGASNSSISPELVKKLGLTKGVGVKLNVKVASGEVKACDRLFKDVRIAISREDFSSNLIQFGLDGINVVLGMDWLGRFRAQILCGEQKVVLRGPSGKRVSYRGSTEEPGIKLVSMMKMKKYVEKGHEIFLCSVENLEGKRDVAQTIPDVCEFLGIFLEEIPGMPPLREVEFSLDLIPGTTLISKAPYCLAPKEMQELKT